MKKILAVLLVLVMVLSLCACTKDVDPGPQTDVDEPAVTEVVPEEPAPAVEEASPYPGKLPGKHACFDKFRIFSKIFVAKLRFFLTNHGKQYILLGYGKKVLCQGLP